MATYATVEDVLAAWDGSTSEARVQVLLDRAERILLRRVPDLADRITAGTTDPLLVADVLARVVTRFLDNPRGYQSETAGEVSYSYGYRGAVSGGGLWFSDEDLADLGLSTGPVVGSVRLAVPGHTLVPTYPMGYGSERYRAGGSWCS